MASGSSARRQTSVPIRVVAWNVVPRLCPRSPFIGNLDDIIRKRSAVIQLACAGPPQRSRPGHSTGRSTAPGRYPLSGPKKRWTGSLRLRNRTNARIYGLFADGLRIRIHFLRHIAGPREKWRRGWAADCRAKRTWQSIGHPLLDGSNPTAILRPLSSSGSGSPVNRGPCSATAGARMGGGSALLPGAAP